MKMNTLSLHKCLSLAGFLTAAREAHRNTMTAPAPWAQELSQKISAVLNSSICEKNDISALKIQPLHLFILLVIREFPNYPCLPRDSEAAILHKVLPQWVRLELHCQAYSSKRAGMKKR